MGASIGQLENILGYRFSDPSLLERAVTHRSWAHERIVEDPEKDLADLQNETLEFVGDSVLGLVIAEQVYRKHPDLEEGDLTLIKHQLVSSETLADIAKEKS